jgi:hypothetical protein
MSGIRSLIEVENYINAKAGTQNRFNYAFSVVLAEEIYQELVALGREPSFFEEESIEKYPWCHLKLITETYVREFNKDTDEKGLKHLIENKIGQDIKTCWEKIPGIIDKLKLDRVRKEGGPWNIYANVVLHSGVPASYFDELFEMALGQYDFYNKDRGRAIEALCENEDIFKYKHFSQYFKNVFESPTEKKMLFRRFVNLVDYLLDVQPLSSELTDNFPPHLLDCIKSKKQEIEIPRKKDEKTTKGGLVFNPARGIIEYMLSIKCFNGNLHEEDIRSEWKKAFSAAKRRNLARFNVSVSPEDLSRQIDFGGIKLPVFDMVTDNSIDTIIFDSNNNLIQPGKEIPIYNEDNALLTVISRDKLLHLNESTGWLTLDDLSWDWRDWRHSEWEVPLKMDGVVEFPAPYGKTRVCSKYERTDICGEWISEMEFPGIPGKLKQFGGDKPPELKFSSKFDIKPDIKACFEDDEIPVEDRYGKTISDNDGWRWISSLDMSAFKGSRYQLEVTVYSNIGSENSEKKVFNCIWYPSLRLEIIPGSLLWPADACTVKFEGNKFIFPGIDISCDIDNSFLTKGDTGYSWTFTQKPPDCIPLFFLGTGEHSLDFYVKLPYLSAWIQTKLSHEFKAGELEWSNIKPFSLFLLKNVVKKDIFARIRFKYLFEGCERLNLYEQTEQTTPRLIRSLSFEKDGHDSINCAELIKFKNPFIRDEETGRKAYIFKNEEIGWSFESIYRQAKNAFLYKNRFYLHDKEEPGEKAKTMEA